MSACHNVIDITGNDYGHLHVVRLSHIENGRSYWTCRCKCGTEITIRKDSFAYKYSKQKSCGCLHRQNSSKRMLEYHKRRYTTLSVKEK